MMNQNKSDDVCAHKNCSCAVNDDSKYCSPSCQAAANNDATLIACDCGHPGCKGEIA